MEDLKNSRKYCVIITDQYGDQVSCQYGAHVLKFLDAHKDSKCGKGQNLSVITTRSILLESMLEDIRCHKELNFL